MAERVARWTIPSLENWCTLLALFILVTNAWRLLLDGDTGWHIRAGDWIVAHRAAPDMDPFSYTMAGRPWFAWEWLTEVMMSQLHAARGLTGLTAWAIVLLTATATLLFRAIARRGGDAFTAFTLTLFGVYTLLIHLLARPHLLSIPLMLIWCGVVEQHRRTGSRGILALPLLIVVWANLHAGFLATFPMLAIYALGEWWEHARPGEAWSRAARGRLATYVGVGLLSLVAGAINPYGVHLYAHLWDFVQQKELLANNLEYISPDFHGVAGGMVEVLLVLAVFAAARAARHGRFVEVGIVLLWSHLSLQSLRHVTLASAVLLPIIGEQLSQAVAGAAQRASAGSSPTAARWAGLRAWVGRMLRTDALVRGAGFRALIFAALVYAAVTGAADRWLPAGFSPKEFPVKAVDFVARERAAGRLHGHSFAHDQYGGYLIYRLYPGVRVFVDGRSDMYARGPVLNEMMAVDNLEPGWADVLDRHAVEWILAPAQNPLSLIAQASGRWFVAYGDATAQVLVRSSNLRR
jgi:hypothetical protein